LLPPLFFTSFDRLPCPTFPHVFARLPSCHLFLVAFPCLSCLPPCPTSLLCLPSSPPFISPLLTPLPWLSFPPLCLTSLARLPFFPPFPASLAFLLYLPPFFASLACLPWLPHLPVFCNCPSHLITFSVSPGFPSPPSSRHDCVSIYRKIPLPPQLRVCF
jgi:hypothetical protein